MGGGRTAKERREKTSLRDGLLELSPCFLPFLKDQLADVVGIPEGKPGQRKLGYMVKTLSGGAFAHRHHHEVAG